MIILIGLIVLILFSTLSIIDDKLNPEPPKYKRL